MIMFFVNDKRILVNKLFMLLLKTIHLSSENSKNYLHRLKMKYLFNQKCSYL